MKPEEGSHVFLIVNVANDYQDRMKNDTEEVKNSAEVVGLNPSQLLLRHVHGDKNAFSELIAMYKAPVYTYLVRCGVAESHRDDLFQEAFLAIHRGAGRFDQSYPLNPWLFRIVANTVRSFFRKERVRSFITPGKIHVALIAHERTEHCVEAKETARWIEARIAALPLKQREVLALTISTSMEQAEIATSLGIPVNSVKTLLRRARMSLANDQKRRSAIQLREIS